MNRCVLLKPLKLGMLSLDYGALMIRIGFWVSYTITLKREPLNATSPMEPVAGSRAVEQGLHAETHTLEALWA